MDTVRSGGEGRIRGKREIGRLRRRKKREEWLNKLWTLYGVEERGGLEENGKERGPGEEKNRRIVE